MSVEDFWVETVVNLVTVWLFQWRLFKEETRAWPDRSKYCRIHL